MIFKTLKPLILASASPRRKDLLESSGVIFEIIPSTFEEPLPESGQRPEEYAKYLAASKAENIAFNNKDSYVIGADTIVVERKNILGKPKNREDAVRMLSTLTGKTHRVITGCAIICPDGEKITFHAITEVDFVDCSIEVLKAYAATGESDDKAGAYAIQGKGAFLVKEVRGSYTNVVGLPLARMIETLVQCEILTPSSSF